MYKYKKPYKFKLKKQLPYGNVGEIFPINVGQLCIPTTVVARTNSKRTAYYVYRIPFDVCVNTPEYFEPIYETAIYNKKTK